MSGEILLFLYELPGPHSLRWGKFRHFLSATDITEALSQLRCFFIKQWLIRNSMSISDGIKGCWREPTAASLGPDI